MSEEAKDNSDYEVGYRKPPKGSQFKKGQSGNHTGKGKVSPNGNDLFQAAMQERVAIQEGGKTIFLTRKHIAVRKRVEESAKGNMSALRELLKLGREAETGESGGKPLVLHVDLVRATGVPLEYTLNDENTVIIRLPKPGTGEGSGAVRAEGSATGQVRRRRRKATEPSSQTFRALISFELARKVRVAGSTTGEPKIMSMHEVIFKQLAHAFASGKSGAQSLALRLNALSLKTRPEEKLHVAVPYDYQIPAKPAIPWTHGKALSVAQPQEDQYKLET